MTDSPVLFDVVTGKEGNLATIRLNSPRTLNALSHSMIQMMIEHLENWQHDPAIKGIFISGEGRAFCAGGNIKSLYLNGRDNTDKSLVFFRDEYHLNQLIFHYTKPYIAYMDGMTMGGGAGVSIHGSHRIITNRFSFAMPETKIGFFPDIGSRYFLTRLPNHYGWYLALTGNTIDADTASQLSLIDFIIDSDQDKALVEHLSKEKFSTHDEVTHILQSHFPQEKKSPLTTDIKSEYVYENFSNLLEHIEQTDLSGKSRFSLEHTFNAYKKALGQSFDTIIQDDFEWCQQFLGHPDFYEGIRALLIDKDNNPQWQECV